MNVSVPVGNVDCLGFLGIIGDRVHLGVGVKASVRDSEEKHQDKCSDVNTLDQNISIFSDVSESVLDHAVDNVNKGSICSIC